MESYNANDATTKLDRKTTERNRRIRMKSSILELISFVPQQFNPSKVLPLFLLSISVPRIFFL